MVLTKAEAYQVLGLPEEGASLLLVKMHYRKLARKYHPDRNSHRREFALRRFQRIVEAFVRLQIDPDDCDQIKMNAITAELFAINEDILDDDYIDDDDDYEVDPSAAAIEDDFFKNNRCNSPVEYSSDPTDSRKGPYSDILQDFYIRSYMSGGRKSKSSSVTTASKPHVSLRARELASQKADELLRDEEEKKKKEERRKLKNKRKKEAKKRKKTKSDEHDADEENEQDASDITDISSAFFARAASKVVTTDVVLIEDDINKLKLTEQKVKSKDTIESKKCDSPVRDEVASHELEQSRHRAVIGNTAAKEGRFQDAIKYFTEAISLYSTDHRYYGNRSFCYEYINDYKRALDDASTAIKLKPDWPKGHFRKGKALAGLEHLIEAEAEYKMALKLDPKYSEATIELRKIQILQLTNMGFSDSLAGIALDKYKNVAGAIDGLINGEVEEAAFDVTNGKSKNGGLKKDQKTKDVRASEGPRWAMYSNLPPRLLHLANPDMSCTVWVGNISRTITEAILRDIFKRCGEVMDVSILSQRHCAFVRYHTPEAAALAMKKLQNFHVGGCYLVLKYPENPTYSPPIPKKSSTEYKAVNGNECHYWRTVGCTYAGKCRYEHIPEHKGIDLTPPTSRKKLNSYKK